MGTQWASTSGIYRLQEGIWFSYEGILTEYGLPTKAFRLIKMCLNETCSTVWTDKHLHDTL